MAVPIGTKVRKSILVVRIFAWSWKSYGSWLHREWRTRRGRKGNPKQDPQPSTPEKGVQGEEDDQNETRNIVIVGASFAGYHVARHIATALPPDSRHRVVVVEPNSHFQFTWVLPRLSVVPGHEHKAFIPYGPHLAGSRDRVRWVGDRVASVGRDGTVTLAGSGEALPYDFLVVATGSGAGDALPSRVGMDAKPEGLERLRSLQAKIKAADKVLVVGGGAAGVEIAADVKGLYPEKKVVLVHSRQAVMNRFGPELQEAALRKLQSLGIHVILGDRVVNEADEAGVATLKSGVTMETDCVINCVGQKPNSALLSDLSPTSINSEGYIKIKATLQVDDPNLPNVYVCGDVAATGERNPNARSAMREAMVVADNILRASRGKQPKYQYRPHWGDALIKLTLGLEDSITHYGDGRTEILKEEKESELDLMSAQCWTYLGAKPFEDPDYRT